jgi:hypothetical protein
MNYLPGVSLDRITRRINLEENDGLSGYDNHACQQTQDAFQVFFDFLSVNKPSNIIEIGTALGGFTMILKTFVDELSIPCNVLTYDIIEYPWYQDMRDRGVDVRVQNVFTETYELNDSYVSDFIKRDGVSVVLCDGGNKVREFNTLSSYLKKGDFILAHDYAVNRELFEQKINRKVWNWCEITQDDIETACNRESLVGHREDIFNNVAWTCKVKE